MVATALTAAPKPDPKESPLEREFTFELLRHLYRWYLDDDLLVANPVFRDAATIEVWIRPLLHDRDEGDRSRFLEVLIPIIQTEVILKKADYDIPELNARIQNRDFKVATVDRYRRIPGEASEYTRVIYERDEVLAYLYRTRNDSRFPGEKVLHYLGDALRERMKAEGPIEIEGDQLIYLAPLSPVSNELWVFWENERKIIRFSSDCDYIDPYYWDHYQVGIDVYDLDDDIVISLIETPGSNAYITKDAVGRVLFNCVVLGKREVIGAEEIRGQKQPSGRDP